MILTKYGSVDGWETNAHRGPYGGSPWKGIMNYLHSFKGGLAYGVGDGRRISFCKDT